MKKKMKAVIGITIILFMLLSGTLLLLNKEEKYKIIFDTNGGNSLSNVEVTKDTTINELEIPKKEGYVFLYWTNDGKIVEATDKITKDMHLVAIWEEKEISLNKYTVIFDTKGGSKVASQEIEEKKTVFKPSNPTKQGYKFKYWTLSGEKYDFNQQVTKNITLVAAWEKINVTTTKPKKKYTVTFDANGSSNIESQTIEEGQNANKPANPQKEGYVFKGWTLNNKEYNFNEKVTKDITLTAIWIEYGDVDLDGVINISDVNSILTYIAQPEKHQLNEVEIKVTDLYEDGKIDEMDVEVLLSILAGILDNKSPIKPLYGDIDLDGKVTISDVTEILDYIASPSKKSLNKIQFKHADLYEDGTVDDMDRKILLDLLSGTIKQESLPINSNK